MPAYIDIGYFGTGYYGTSTYGGTYKFFAVTGAVSLNAYAVVVEFNMMLDFTLADYLDPANYVIPNLTVTAAAFYAPNAVVLTTSQQTAALYVVTVQKARSSLGWAIDILHRSASFTGHGASAAFFAVGVGPSRVRLMFASTMLQNAALSDPHNYSLFSFDGGSPAVVGVTVEQPNNVVSIVLTLDAPMLTTAWYQVTVGGAVQTTGGLSMVPATSTFQWVNPLLSVTLPLSEFTGAIGGGFLQATPTLVFFSPALTVPVARSVIEVEEVSVCTVAYDTYTPPSLPDPLPLYTWGQTAPQTWLNDGGMVLWAPMPRLMEARFDLDLFPTDTVVAPLDGPATATFREPWDHTFVALLNNPYWELTPPQAAKAPFITAMNLAPIPQGPVVTVVLQP